MEIDYESILGKAELSLDIPSNVNRSFESERVLVTGAGGSIGSQITIRLASIPNIQLFATDRDENRLHSLSLKIEGSALFNSTVYNVLDIRDRQGVENVFAGFKPTLVVHAAALKHLISFSFHVPNSTAFAVLVYERMCDVCLLALQGQPSNLRL